MSAHNKRSLSAPTVRAFTLVEMLAVMAIVTVLVSVSVPALKGLAIGTGRKGAVSILMNGIDQARITAIEQGNATYIGFADESLSDDHPDACYSKFIIFRERDPEVDGVILGSNFVPLGTWVSLPQSISISSTIDKSVVGQEANRVAITSTDGFPLLQNGGSLPCVKFNSAGTVSSPAAEYLQIFLYEGFYAYDRDNFSRRGSKNSEPMFDKLVIGKYTGRPQLQVMSKPPAQ